RQVAVLGYVSVVRPKAGAPDSHLRREKRGELGHAGVSAPPVLAEHVTIPVLELQRQRTRCNGEQEVVATAPLRRSESREQRGERRPPRRRQVVDGLAAPGRGGLKCGGFIVVQLRDVVGDGL